jgi:hypothetical protein
MAKNIILLFSVLFISCGSNGIEGYVSEPITITAEKPDDGNDLDYFWALSNQPDGSLMNSNDLVSMNNGNKMTFIPDYPGDYSIEVIISEYGDEISNQIFNFSILDFSERENKENLKDTLDNESWLDEELDGDLDELTSEQEELDKDADELTSAQEDSDEEADKFTSVQEEFDEEAERLVSDKEKLSKKVGSVSKSMDLSKTKLRKSNISERTDRFTIQITSKKMLKDAQLFSNELIKKGYDAYIQKVLFNSNETFYRVRVGSYDNYNSAKIAANSLSKDLKMTTWVDFVRKEQ